MQCAIVLAAGRSRRMGTQKLLLPFAGSTVLGRVVDAFLTAPMDRVVVVVRRDSQALREALGARPVAFVENPDPDGDMLSSVRCGLRALPDAVEMMAVSPGDQPSIEAGLIRRMLAAYRAGSQGILVPVHDRRRGHPLLVAGWYRHEVLTGYDGVGLRGLLDRHAAGVHEWHTDDAAVLEDLDTPAEFKRAQAAAQARDRVGPWRPS